MTTRRVIVELKLPNPLARALAHPAAALRHIAFDMLDFPDHPALSWHEQPAFAIPARRARRRTKRAAGGSKRFTSYAAAAELDLDAERPATIDTDPSSPILGIY